MTITAQLLDPVTITSQIDLVGGWKDAWLHELRGPDGEWITGPEHNAAHLAAATGRAARGIRLHDRVLYGKTEPGMSGGMPGLNNRIVPMEVVGLHHHFEGHGKTKGGVSRRHRYTDLVYLDPDTGDTRTESVKDGTSVKLYPREAFAAARKPKAAPPPPAAPVPVPVKTIAQQVAEAFDEGDASYETQHQKPAAPAAALPPLARAARSPDETYQSVKQSNGTLSHDEDMALGVYGTTFGYTLVNPYLHHDGQVFDTSKKKYVPASPHQKARAGELIKSLDSAFSKSAPLPQPVTTYRGTGNMDDLFGPVGSRAGKTFTSKAYTSTTTVPEAEGGNDLDYETKQGKLEISVPAGSKVITGNDFEHEVILPRNAKFTVLSDKMDGPTRHVKLLYQPAAGPPPLTAPPAKAPAVAPSPVVPSTPSADAADEAEKQAEGISMLGQMGGRSTQLAVIKKKSIGELQAADYGFQQRAATRGGKVTAAHQMVRDEITARGGTLADLTAPVRVQGAAEIAQRAKKALVVAWSTSYRYKGTTEAKDKRIADFAVEMHRLLSTNKQPAKCGPGCQDAHKFLAMVDTEATVQPKELQRGLTLSPAAAERMFQPGKTLDMPVSSWTADPEVGALYAKGEDTPGKVKVLIHAAPGAKGMNISALSLWHGSASGAGAENETVTGGRMNVDKVETVNGVMNVYLTQQGFSAH